MKGGGCTVEISELDSETQLEILEIRGSQSINAATPGVEQLIFVAHNTS